MTVIDIDKRECGFCDLHECKGHLLVDVLDAAAFWSALTPEQALALLKKAPRVAGPWTKIDPSEWGAMPWVEAWRRERVNPPPHDNESSDAAFVVNRDNGQTCWEIGINVPDDSGVVVALAEAKAAADAALRAAGWVLVDDAAMKGGG